MPGTSVHITASFFCRAFVLDTQPRKDLCRGHQAITGRVTDTMLVRYAQIGMEEKHQAVGKSVNLMYKATQCGDPGGIQTGATAPAISFL